MNVFSTDVLLTNADRSGSKLEGKSPAYIRGYQDGWWQQPEEEPENSEYVEGHDNGWLCRNLDRR